MHLSYTLARHLKDYAKSSTHPVISNSMRQVVPGKLYDFNCEYTLQGTYFLFSLVLLAWLYAVTQFIENYAAEIIHKLILCMT